MIKILRIIRRIRAIPPWDLFKKQPKLLMYRPRMIDHPENMTFGQNTSVREYSWISTIPSYAGVLHAPQLDIGNDVYIGRYVCITCIDRVTIGDECVLSEHVYVADSAHGNEPDGDLMMLQPLVSRGPVDIGRRCFIGYGARVLSGTTLGDNCVVGANAVVTKSFEPYSMIAGVPAKLIKRYNRQTKQWDNVE